MTTQLKPASDSQDQDRPLVSFVVLAYKQEQFIREAVAGAFAQSYSPLEIILSDDCSPDRTFEIMQEMAAGYRGPHKIILNRNAHNMGLIRHVNAVSAACHGELLVGAAGDDISLPERTSKLVDAWIAAGKGTAFVYSQLQRITMDGKPIHAKTPILEKQNGDPIAILKNWGGQISGASSAFTSSLWKIFGPLNEDTPYEDKPMFWRGAMAGKIVFVPDTLVLWRMGAGISTCSYGENFSPVEKSQLWKKIVQEHHRFSHLAQQDIQHFSPRNAALMRAARRFQRESGYAKQGMEGNLAVFLLSCIKSFAFVGYPSPLMRDTIHYRLRHWFQNKRSSSSFGWKLFFWCYDSRK